MEKLNLLSVRAAAKAYGIPYWLLLGAVNSGRIRSVQLSKRRLIPDAALRVFVEDANRPAQIQEVA
jgi:hypothetical protein